MIPYNCFFFFFFQAEDGIRDLVRSRGLGDVYKRQLLVVDGVHFVPHLLTDVRAIDCDFMLCSAYKFYGPHVGILYSRPGALDRLDTDRLRVQTPVSYTHLTLPTSDLV